MKKSLFFGCTVSLLTVLVFLTGCPNPAGGNNPRPDNKVYTVSGKISEEGGAVLSGAGVQLQTAAGSASGNAVTTNAKGEFKIEKVGAGKYQIKVSLSNYEDRTSETFNVPAKTSVNVMLKKIPVNSAPAIKKAEVKDAAADELVLTFNLDVEMKDASGFSAAASSALAITSLKGKGAGDAEWILKLGREVQKGETITLSYNGKGTVKSKVSQLSMAAVSAIAVTNNVKGQTPPPSSVPLTLTSMIIDESVPTTIIVTFSQGGTFSKMTTFGASGFTVTSNKNYKPNIAVVNSMALNGEGFIVLNRRIYKDETIRMAYAGSPAIKTDDGRALENFAASSVTNKTTTPVPDPVKITAAEIKNGDPALIVLTVNRDDFTIDRSGSVNGGFSAKVNNAPVSVSKASRVQGEANTIFVVLAAPVNYGNTVTFSYTGNAVKDNDGNILAAFTDRAVVNSVRQPVVKAKVVSAVVQASDPKKVVLTFDKKIAFDGKDAAGDSAFGFNIYLKRSNEANWDAVLIWLEPAANTDTTITFAMKNFDTGQDFAATKNMLLYLALYNNLRTDDMGIKEMASGELLDEFLDSVVDTSQIP